MKYKRFKEKILSTCHLPMKEQGRELELFFDKWRGELEQIDDVCIVGIEIDQMDHTLFDGHPNNL